MPLHIDDTASQAATAVAGAYGSAPVFTTAQLLALTAGNRPPVAYCSDCLVPEGVGSPVVWNGTAWVCTCSGMPATTDLLIYYRARAKSCPVMATAVEDCTSVFPAFSAQNSGASYVSAGTGQIGRTISAFLATSTSATAGVRSSTASHFGFVSSAGAASFYMRQRISFSALSDGVEKYNYRLGSDSGATYALGANALGIGYDAANAVGIDPDSAGRWKLFTRNSNTMTFAASDGPLVTADTQTVELLFDGANLRGFVGGIAFGSIAAASVPTGLILGFFCLNKSAGTTSRGATILSPFTIARYTTAEA